MIAALAVAAAAIASTISAPPEIHARLQMDHQGAMDGIVENVTGRTLEFVKLECKTFDAAGLIVDAPETYVSASSLGPHAAARVFASGRPLGQPVRFTCSISYDKALSR